LYLQVILSVSRIETFAGEFIGRRWHELIWILIFAVFVDFFHHPRQLENHVSLDPPPLHIMSMEHSTFSSSGMEAISRQLDLDLDHLTANLPKESLLDYYDDHRVADEIIRENRKRVSM
jgi:hypothetical protein